MKTAAPDGRNKRNFHTSYETTNEDKVFKRRRAQGYTTQRAHFKENNVRGQRRKKWVRELRLFLP